MIICLASVIRLLHETSDALFSAGCALQRRLHGGATVVASSAVHDTALVHQSTGGDRAGDLIIGAAHAAQCDAVQFMRSLPVDQADIRREVDEEIGSVASDSRVVRFVKYVLCFWRVKSQSLLPPVKHKRCLSVWDLLRTYTFG